MTSNLQSGVPITVNHGLKRTASRVRILKAGSIEFGGVRDGGVAHCGCLGCVRELGVGGERRCAVLDRHCAGVLDPARTAASKPGDDPTRESDRCAQRRRHCRKSPRVYDPVVPKGSA
jgi:hypothetical protein